MDAELRHEIARLTATLRQRGAVIGATWGICGALSLGLALALLGRLTPLWYRLHLLTGLVAMLLLAFPLGALLGYVWPRPLPGRLRRLERAMGLAERLTTAWELAQGRIAALPSLATLQAQETLAAVRHSDPRAAFPLRPPRALVRGTLLVAVLLTITLALPNPQEQVLTRRIEEQQAATAAAEELNAIREAVAESDALSAAEREAALQALDEALATLQDRQSSPAEQQAALNEAEQALQALRSAEAEAQTQRLSEAAPLSTEAVVEPLSAALQRGDIEAAAQYLRDLTDPTSGDPLTAEEMQALADAFEQLADNLQESDAELSEQFRDIAQEIYRGDMAEATEAVNQAADSLSDVAQSNAPNEDLESAQAGVQQAQDSLGQGQGQSPGAAPGSGQADGSPGGIGGHEDTGSGAPYGPDTAPRVEDEGGEITIPRETAEGDPRLTEGSLSAPRVSYREVYADYAAAAEAQMSENAYPPALRAYVREYFGGLGE